MYIDIKVNTTGTHLADHLPQHYLICVNLLQDYDEDFEDDEEGGDDETSIDVQVKEACRGQYFQLFHVVYVLYRYISTLR